MKRFVQIDEWGRVIDRFFMRGDDDPFLEYQRQGGEKELIDPSGDYGRLIVNGWVRFSGTTMLKRVV